MSRRCPRCKSVYAGGARFCPKDGSPLVDVTGPGGTVVTAGGSAATPKPGGRTVVRGAVKAAAGVSLHRAGSLVGEVIDRRYEVLRRLGEGGMAFVYEARDLSGGESVAIKVLQPKIGKEDGSVERLRREAGLAMRLDHPNACRIQRLGETEDGLIYLVMPYLRGELLSEREVRVGQLDFRTGIEILVQCCAGLHHAHELNIVHRDLKPENVMLVPQDDGREIAVVMDFGLAKERRASPGVAKLTATGIILGTPEFMSPEQIRGKVLDRRSDVYALSIMGYEMFTAKLPFEGRSPQEMMIARLRGKPTPPRRVRRDVPPALESVLMKALESEPNNRYATAWDFGQALVEVLDAAERDAVRRYLV
jgi:serine/threonine protein kinase